MATRGDTVEGDVLAAVERLLGAGASFTALPIQRIAEEARVARTTLYGHFQDKATLLMRITETASQGLFDRSTAWVEDDESTRDELVVSLRALLADYRAHALLFAALAELSAYEPAVAAYWHGRVEGWAGCLRERLVRDAAAGRCPADLDVATTASWIAWGTERAVAMQVANRPAESDGAFAEGLAAATWASLQRG